MLLVLPLWLAASFRLDATRTVDDVRCSPWYSLVWGFENAVLMTTLTVLLAFFSRQFGDPVSRSFASLLFPVAFLLLVPTRFVTLSLLALAERSWLRPIRIAIVGDRIKAAAVIERMEGESSNLIRGMIIPEDTLAHASVNAIPILGTTRQIVEVVNREQLDHLVVVNASLSGAELAHCAQVAQQMDLNVSCALDFISEPFHVAVGTDYGLPFIHLKPIHFTRGQQIAKRAFDLLVASAILSVLAPALLVIAALIKLTSQGPVLYKSRRVGKGGRHFTFLKFRSMYVNSDRGKIAGHNEKSGHIFKMRKDPRITPLGSFLRRYSLDELPQLINVIRGEMSIVGPRPLPASDLGPDGMSEHFAAWSEGRARALPGLTGLWQVSGRSDLSFEDMVKLDLTYIQHWSVWLDIRIIIDTPLVVFRGIGAY
jgi:exopolysaccharide biosynthesis polyprenyl glycosylphosphotransferase